MEGENFNLLGEQGRIQLSGASFLELEDSSGKESEPSQLTKLRAI